MLKQKLLHLGPALYKNYEFVMYGLYTVPVSLFAEACVFVQARGY
jgi:hypothetical protein